MRIYKLNGDRPLTKLEAAAAAIAGIAALAVVLSGCAAVSPSASHTATTPARANLATGELGSVDSNLGLDWLPLHFGYTGQVETITVPANVTSVDLSATGASGSDEGSSLLNKGYGATASGTLAVKAGDKLTIAVGQEGRAADGDRSPGVGGWSLSPYEGGNGGSSHGSSQVTDGSGGGGASVIEINGKPIVIGGGGGGEGGTIDHAQVANRGGWAAYDKAYDGNSTVVKGDGRGHGGDWKAKSTWDKNGTSYSGSFPIKGGGGGGGGGGNVGEGGAASTQGGSGGGGGTSDGWQPLTNFRTYEGQTCSDYQIPVTCNLAGNEGNGVVTVTYHTDNDSNLDYAIQKTDAPNTELLQSSSGVTGESAAISTSRRILVGGHVEPAQKWTFEYQGATQTGQFKNAETGLCLEVNGTSGDVDQWTCASDQANHRWKLIARNDGDIALAITLAVQTANWSPGTYYLASANQSDSVSDGDRVSLTTDIGDARTAWTLISQ